MWSPGRKWRIMYRKSWPRPSGGVPGSLVPAYVHTVTGNHLYGGHPGWCSSTPWGPQLGHSGIHDPVFAQVILGLGALSGYGPATIAGSAQMPDRTAMTENVQCMPIPLEGNMMVPTRLFPGKQVRRDGTANHPIYLGNNTDSGISSICRSTPMKTPVKTPGGQCHPFASTPKSKPKLLVTAQQQWNELAAMKQGAPHSAHVHPFLQQASRPSLWA